MELHLSARRSPGRLIKPDKKARSCLRRTMGHPRTKVARAEPSGPTEAPSRKKHDSLSNIFLRGNCRNYSLSLKDSGRSLRLRFPAAEGCFSFKALRVSPSCAAKPAADASSLTAPLTSPSANLAATLLFGVSSHPRTPSPLLVVTCTAGRSVPSINRATCCLTSVESETSLTLQDSPGHPKPQYLKDIRPSSYGDTYQYTLPSQLVGSLLSPEPSLHPDTLLAVPPPKGLRWRSGEANT